MSKLDYGTYLQLDNYHHLDEAIEDLVPELKQDLEVQMLCDKVKWANHNLRKKVESLVDWDGEDEDA